MPSMNTDHVDIEKVTYFVLHVTYNLPKREKSPGFTRITAMRFAPAKSPPSDQKSLTMEILRAHLISHSWLYCLDCNYQSIDPEYWLDFCRWCSTTYLL